MTHSPTSDLYDVNLIQGKDGAPISEYAKKKLIQHRAHYDETLQGFIIEGGLPMAYMAFLPMNNLVAKEVEIDYDIGWFQERMTKPVFDPLDQPWDGRPVNDFSAFISWFDTGEGEPFLAFWVADSDHWQHKQMTASPDQALANGWRFLATAAECIDMNVYRIDVALGQRAGQAEIEKLHKQQAFAALEVAISSNRI
jgi:hypothetical protein